MAYTYLRAYEYYSDLYDSGTIKECLYYVADGYPSDESLGKEIIREDGVVMTIEEKKREYGRVLHVFLVCIKGERYLAKEGVIKEWMERDRELDTRLGSVSIPSRYCDRCGGVMTCMDTGYHGIEYTQILLTYRCEDCSRVRMFLDNGHEYIPTNTCVKCQSQNTTTTEKTEGYVVVTDTCSVCRHVEVHEFRSGPPTPEEVAEQERARRQFIIDREKYCLTPAGGAEYVAFKESMDEFRVMFDGFNTEKEDAALYAKVDQMKKLTILELEHLLGPLLEKEGYTKPQFSPPDMSKWVIITFGVYDSQSDRQERESELQLQKILKTALAETNWRLMSEGVSYRMGYVSGRLKGYDRREELVVLLKNGDKVKL